MPQNTRTVETRILNTNISVIVNDENEAKILKIFDFVKEKLENLRKRNPGTNAIQVAVLGCMNVTEQLFDEQTKMRGAERTTAFLNEKNQSLNEELQKAKDAWRILTGKTENLQKKLEELQKERANQELVITEKNDRLESLWQELQTAKSEAADYQGQMVRIQKQQQAAEKAVTEQEDLVKQYQEQLEAANSEVERYRNSNVDLQNRLFETQIELDNLKGEI